MASTNTPFPTSDDVPAGAGLGSEDEAGTPYPRGESAAGSASASSASRQRMDRVVQGAHQVVDRLAAKAAPLVDRFGSRIDDASDSLHDRAGQWSQTQDEWMHSARTTVREHPLAAVAAAVALGVLISRIAR